MSLIGRIGGALKGAVTGFVTGGPAGALGGATLGAVSSGGARRPSTGATPTALVASQPSRSCPPGSYGIYPACINAPGGQVTGGGAMLTYGEAVTARYGAALVPASRSITVRRCPRGAVLANDGYCYNRSQLNKRDRMWIPGRKPLLTGGDLNAISRAARAANKMKVQQKRLEQLGLLAKPNRGRGGRSRAPQFVGPGVQVIDTGR